MKFICYIKKFDEKLFRNLLQKSDNCLLILNSRIRLADLIVNTTLLTQRVLYPLTIHYSGNYLVNVHTLQKLSLLIVVQI